MIILRVLCVLVVIKRTFFMYALHIILFCY
nr:MAG TPA: hypothetical protein [Caudoviricetes sp.]